MGAVYPFNQGDRNSLHQARGQVSAESQGAPRGHVILQFDLNPPELMYIACLWSF